MDRTAIFLSCLETGAHYKGKITSVRFGCFILGNAECTLPSHNYVLLAADLCDSRTAPPEWPSLSTSALLMACASFLGDWATAYPAATSGTGLSPQLSPASSSYQSPGWGSLVTSPLCCCSPGSSTTIFRLENPNSLLLVVFPFQSCRLSILFSVCNQCSLCNADLLLLKTSQ